jgi:hypothetical protein
MYVYIFAPVYNFFPLQVKNKPHDGVAEKVRLFLNWVWS